MNQGIYGKSSLQAIYSLILLYFGKVAGLVINLVFIPIYSRELGTQQFGAVAIILSMQALMITLDLGMATLISRELSDTTKSKAQRVRVLQNAETLIAIFFFAIMIAAICSTIVIDAALNNTKIILLSIVLIFLLVIQNFHYIALIASGEYARATLIQSIGNIARGAITVASLSIHEATVEVYVTAQLLVATIHVFVSQQYSQKLIEYKRRISCHMGVDAIA